MGHELNHPAEPRDRRSNCHEFTRGATREAFSVTDAQRIRTYRNNSNGGAWGNLRNHGKALGFSMGKLMEPLKHGKIRGPTKPLEHGSSQRQSTKLLYFHRDKSDIWSCKLKVCCFVFLQTLPQMHSTSHYLEDHPT